MIRPVDVGAFYFATLASLRVVQLKRGCLPRVDDEHSAAVTAQLEIAAGKVTPLSPEPEDALPTPY